MHLRHDHCEPPTPTDTLTDRLNRLLGSSGPGYILSLCPGERYTITAPLRFSASDQEIRTAGYPTGSTRAMLIVDGPIVNGTGHTTAIDGTCQTCHGVKVRNVQIDGNRLARPAVKGGANIEMGGSNSDQLIEYVRSFDPRGWSCLHLQQGNHDGCTGATIQHNEIGPAGSIAYRQWADGISVACRNSVVRNNMISDPTDGGIVLFGAPGTIVENNVIWVEKHTLLGGINLVDISPFDGNYEGVVVTENTIIGGFASQLPGGSEKTGTHKNNSIIKIGIAIGPRTWFGKTRGNNVSRGGVVRRNRLTGAFSYGIAINSATDFIVENNVLFGNTSFIGQRAPNCTSSETLPSPAPFVITKTGVHKSTIQSNFTSIAYNDSLVNCVAPPAGGAYWPFGRDRPYNGVLIDSSKLSYEFGHPNWGDRGVIDPTTVILLALFAMALIALTAWCRSFLQLCASVRRPRLLVGYVWQGFCLALSRFTSGPYPKIT